MRGPPPGFQVAAQHGAATVNPHRTCASKAGSWVIGLLVPGILFMGCTYLSSYCLQLFIFSNLHFRCISQDSVRLELVNFKRLSPVNFNLPAIMSHDGEGDFMKAPSSGRPQGSRQPVQPSWGGAHAQGTHCTGGTGKAVWLQCMLHMCQPEDGHGHVYLVQAALLRNIVGAGLPAVLVCLFVCLVTRASACQQCCTQGSSSAHPCMRAAPKLHASL